MNYLFAAYGAGVFPPGKRLIFDDVAAYRRLLRNYLRAHVVIYDALTAADTIDADGDGVAAHIGFTLSLVDWVPARGNAPSDHPQDVAATEKVLYYYHRLYVDSLRGGTFDADLDGAPDEDHPDWAGKLDWLGVQYYFRGGVTGETQLFPVVDATFCYPPLDFGRPPRRPTGCRTWATSSSSRAWPRC
jgi:beta-glucosidase